jgi:hypothetical protein
MLPPETDNTTPEHPFIDKHETLSTEEKTLSKSFHRRMQRDPEFRLHVMEHD